VRAQPRAGPIRLVVGFNAGARSTRSRARSSPSSHGSPDGARSSRTCRARTAPRAIARVAASDANGDTLLVGSSALAHPDTTRPVRALLRPVVLASTMPMVLVVRASMPVHDPASFAKYLADHPGATYGSSGIATRRISAPRSSSRASASRRRTCRTAARRR
jgi:hypothetical protein